MTRSAPVLALGELSWYPSVDHATVTSYEVRLRVYPTGTLVGSINVGKPFISLATGRLYSNIASWFTQFPDDDYTVSVAAIAPGGTTDSAVSDVFSLPLVQ